jgi:hypothetical protein
MYLTPSASRRPSPFRRRGFREKPKPLHDLAI